MYIYFFCFSAVFVLPRTAKVITLPSQRNHSSTLILSQIALTANFIYSSADLIGDEFYYKMALFTGFPVNAARRTTERLEDLCKTELRSTIETSDSPVPRPPPFQNMPTTPETSHSGTK